MARVSWRMRTLVLATVLDFLSTYWQRLMKSFHPQLERSRGFERRGEFNTDSRSVTLLTSQRTKHHTRNI
ncbi:hypothetical protein [Nostoc sp. DSM 114161]|uniref:hypothetical protein n=1 Tax=Nostoc sp. DSM 114161 TaxID=3440143 RepID=UPI004045923F